MDNKTNSAQRVLEIMEQVLSKSSEIAAAQAWAEVFGLDAKLAVSDPHHVWQKLSLIRIEIDAIPGLMAQTPIPDRLYLPYLNQLKLVVSAPNISAPWKSYSGNISAEARLALGFCANLIPSEPVVSKDELQKVLDLVVQLKVEIEALSLSPGLQEFLIRQLAIIQTGVLDYPISGISSIKNAIKEGVMDIPPDVSSPTDEGTKDKEGSSKVGRAWKVFHNVAKGVVDTDKLLTTLVTRLEQGMPLLEKGLALLP